ncbi:LysR family transcriptional regulator [Phycicoccus avicenniae]|uniref:LysR family transcriptional regulator n=1 Tax=Phycicoccus avicenniae TaxID=2828860 RepID=UPI003D264DCB
MDLRDLEWLVALDGLGHVTDTAAALGTSQPTLSRTVARVETELGTRVFERLPHGVVTTPDGRLVVEAAREVTERWRRLRAEVDGRLDPEGGVVRLAFLDSMATSLVPRLLRAFHEEAPRVRVVLRQEPNHEILADLRSGTSELAVTSPRPDGPFAWLPLQEERLVVVVPPSHRWARRRRLRVADLAGEGLVTTPVGFGFRTIVDSLLAEAGVTADVAFESADLATIEGLVAAGLGIALVPEQFAGASGSVGIALDAPRARRTIGLTWRADHELAPPAARLLAFVRDRRRGGGL